MTPLVQTRDRNRERESGRSGRTPTLRGGACVLLYTAAFVAVTLVGFAPMPRRLERALQRAVLRPAAWAGNRVDWAAHGWVDRTRRRLGTDPRFRAFTRLVLDDAVSAADEAAGYVGTVDPPAGTDPCEWVERGLVGAGFHRNPTAYLEYREREGREYEHSSWALRSSVDADHQLHVRLFRSGGSVDVYGHWEPSVTAGGNHYGRPDYRTGVATTLAVLDREGIPFERYGEIGGVVPADVTDIAARADTVGMADVVRGGDADGESSSAGGPERVGSGDPVGGSV